MTTRQIAQLPQAKAAATSLMQRYQTELAATAVLVALIAGATLLRLWVALNHTI